MNQIIREIVLLLDEAAAETPELQWIEPLSFLKGFVFSLESSGIVLDNGKLEGMLTLCSQMANLVREGKLVKPDLPRRILFGVIDVACSSIRPDGVREIRAQCTRWADSLRAIQKVRPLFRRAWRVYSETIQKDETAAFENEAADLEEAFGGLLATCETAIRADCVQKQVMNIRGIHEQYMLLNGGEARG